MTPIKPFQLSVPQKELDDLKTRLALTRFPSDFSPGDRGEWSYGAPNKVIQELVEYWQTGFDWRKVEADINAKLPQFTTVIPSEQHGDLNIHFVHKMSTRTSAVPLLFVHGWPGSFLEVSKIIDELTEPSDPAHPAFHVVAPSIPGFNFSEGSDKPGLGVKAAADIFNKLMLKLGYEIYLAQGGDWGAIVVRALAVWESKNCRGVHSNMFISYPPSPLQAPYLLFKLIAGSVASLVGFELFYTKKQMQNLKALRKTVFTEGGYRIQQATFPQTLAFALSDSPAGLLAWIYEKLHRWSQNYPWTPDEILTWVMIYWIDQGPGGGLRFYKENLDQESPHNKQDREDVFTKWSNVPFGVSFFPGEIAQMLPDWATMQGPVVFSKVHESGGHFAAWEKPKELVGDIRSFATAVISKDLSFVGA